MNAEQKAALISFNEEKLAGLKFSLKQSAFESVKEIITKEIASTEIALASLTTKAAGVVNGWEQMQGEPLMYKVLPYVALRYGDLIFTAPPVPVMKAVKCPTFDDYQPHIARELREAFKAAVREAGIQIEGEE